jgi:hypothetical protein
MANHGICSRPIIHKCYRETDRWAGARFHDCEDAVKNATRYGPPKVDA